MGGSHPWTVHGRKEVTGCMIRPPMEAVDSQRRLYPGRGAQGPDVGAWRYRTRTG